jgi:hypothetical protein
MNVPIATGSPDRKFSRGWSLTRGEKHATWPPHYLAGFRSTAQLVPCV